MLAAERLHKIVELVNERGSIRVSELSEILGVTEETIRRDLDKLEGEGKLLRSHGGAVSVRDTQAEVPYAVREVMNNEEKSRIAAEAVKHIEAGERIILDASTTAWFMARLLPDMPLTVLTNSLKVAVELSTKEKIQVISTGGRLTHGSLSYVGPLAERSLEQYYVDKLFFSCKGVHTERGVSETNEAQAQIKQRMIAIAERVYLLADYSKFGVQAFTHVSGWGKVKHLITDSRTNAEDLGLLKEAGVDVIRA
ncbi:DeoR/GlpR family DNA-binding transcription regulator [Paenibacillus sp. MBLB4367]|uniref:DeoR/GlpR family DNA-binding transcription regulator n=1 Tax=Paenibacillus sp. MBLB4367 TaxID=3384767 RepID=UPI003907F142